MSDHSTEPAYVREARYLGWDAGLASASWVEMSESDARSVLDDVDPEVMDRYQGPNLSGEWADDPTPTSLARDIELDPEDSDAVDAACDVWQSAADEAYYNALEGCALRVLGRIDDALAVERRLEAEADRLRAER